MDPADCSVKRNLGGVEPGKDVRVRVAADREVAAEMGVTVTGAAHYSLTRFWQRIRECYILVSFRPIEEHVYQLAYREDADKCFVHVRDLGKEGTSPGAPVKVEHRIRLSGDRGTSDPHCLRLPPP
jgi:hypothetical protein